MVRVKNRDKALILTALALPVLIHESWHATTDPRSPLYPFHSLFDWASPIFEDENVLAGHIAVNFCSVAFIGLSLWWVAKR